MARTTKKYIVTKRPGELAVVTACATETLSSDSIRKYLDDSWFTITHITVGSEVLDLWCDDEGMFKKLEYNFWHSQLSQPILGPVVVCACNSSGDSIGVSKKLADATAKWLNGNS